MHCKNSNKIRNNKNNERKNGNFSISIPIFLDISKKSLIFVTKIARLLQIT